MHETFPVTLRRALACLCLLMLAWSACATPTSTLRFKRLGSLGADELSTLSLLQDRQGFIWIGTHTGGLYRYNGYQAVKYLNSPHNLHSLPHDRVSALFEDRAGHIWAGTQNGLARFNPETDDFTRFAPPPGPSSQLIIKSIISDGQNGMWLATWGGLQHFDPAKGTFTLYTHDPAKPDSLASNDLNALALDDHGGLWVATWPGGLDYLPATGGRFEHHRIDSDAAPDPKLNIVRALHFDRSRTLWIGTESGTLTWQAGSEWASRRRLDGPVSRVNYFFADHNDSVWAGTLSAGLLRWDKGASSAEHFTNRPNDQFSLPSDHVRAIMEDRAGMLWIATFTDGIALVNLNSQGFQRFIPFDAEPANPIPNNSLQALAGAPRSKLWLGTNSGMALFDPASGKISNYYHADPKRPGALSNPIIYSLYQQPEGPLWVGTAAGLNRLDQPDGKFTVIHFDNIASDFINAISPGSGGTLWLGTGRDVVRYHPGTGARQLFVHNPNDPTSRSVTGTTAIVEDRKGRVWMGSEWNGGGLDLLDPASGKFTHFHHVPGDANSLGDDNVSTLFEDAQGRVWAGTAKGLNEVITAVDGHISFRSFAFKNSVGHTKVLAVRADPSGMLWISTSAGLTRLDPNTGRVTNFTPTDGLTEGFTVAAAYAAPDGTLYFGGVRGMTAVHPGQVQSRSIAPQVAITDVSVFNRSLKGAQRGDGVKLAGPVTAPTSLTLSVQDSVFSLEFAALHYANPARNTYAYRLAGFDRDWVETDAEHRSATYTNLNPGDYVFEVKAANDQGVWSERAASLTISITPPYWETWWFRAAAVLLATGILATAYRLRVRRLTRQKVQLEELVAARTRELEGSNAKLEALSTTDSLTGITNRRGFDGALKAEWRRAKRANLPLSLVMLDVDHFKAFNDRYGHQAGDQCLRDVANVIANHARRTSDLAARYGGEEFALLIPATNGPDALLIARAICEDLQRLGVPHAGSPYGVVTISIGIAALVPHEHNSAEILVHDADQALYRAKQEGRNRAALAGQPTAQRPAPLPVPTSAP
ncbi:MAG: diguanylate cyclase [Pseudomonadota bacterium]